MPILKKSTYAEKFTILPNSFLQNRKLSYETRGLLGEILSYPEDWEIRKEYFKRDYARERKLTRMFKELQENGYLYIYNILEEGTSRIIQRLWVATDEPKTERQFFDLIKNKEDWTIVRGSLKSFDDSLTCAFPNPTKPHVRDSLTCAFPNIGSSHSKANAGLLNTNIIIKTKKDTKYSSSTEKPNQIADLNNHVDKVKTWYQKQESVIKSDFIPLWKHQYPNIKDRIEEIINEAYISLLAHPSSATTYMAYISKWITNAARGKYDSGTVKYDEREEESIIWYVNNHPYGYSYSDLDEEKGYIRQVLAFVDRNKKKGMSYKERIELIFKEYWKLNKELDARFEYIERSNWKLRYLPEAINYLIALNRTKLKQDEKKQRHLVDLKPVRPGMYYMQEKGNGEKIERIRVYENERNQLETEKGLVNELDAYWSISTVEGE